MVGNGGRKAWRSSRGSVGEGSGVVRASDVNWISDGGGSAELRHDSNVGAAGGVGETRESFASKWARGIKSRADAADSRRRKGREWISSVMSSRLALSLIHI